MDERVQALLRQGDTDSIIEACGVLIRAPDQHPRVRALLHPVVKFSPAARELFVSLLPEGAHAFCIRCGEKLPLNVDGYPKGKRPERPRKKAKYCRDCEGSVRNMIRAHSHHMSAAEAIERYGSAVYCGRCGSVVDRCLCLEHVDGQLPEHMQ